MAWTRLELRGNLTFVQAPLQARDHRVARVQQRQPDEPHAGVRRPAAAGDDPDLVARVRHQTAWRASTRSTPPTTGGAA